MLDLRRTFVPYALDLLNCSFDHAPVLSEAHLKHGVALRGCSMPGFFGDNLSAEGPIHLSHGFQSKGKVDLGHARISGLLSCSGGTFDSNHADALLADGIAVQGGVFLNQGFKASGTIRLLGAQIDGPLLCTTADIDGRQGNALSVDGAVVGGGIFLDRGFKAVGAVGLSRVRIGGPLICTGGSFHSESGDALSLSGAVIKGDAFLDTGFKATGTVRLAGAQISGTLTCSAASFDGHQHTAIAADGIVIRGAAFFNNGFRAEGLVHLLGAQIDGQLNCNGASFDAKDGVALAADGAVFKSGAFFQDGFKAGGTVRFPGARIDGPLDCTGASFDGRAANALIANDIRVAGTMELRNLERPLRGVSLTGARVHKLIDDAKTWAGDLDLDGFVYDFLANTGPMRAAQRVKWLDLQHAPVAGLDSRRGAYSNFRPQPWRQLQRYFESMGHVEEAREVGIAFEHRLRRVGLVGQGPSQWPEWLRLVYVKLAHSFHSAHFWLTGYGYRPMRLLAWFLGTWIACAAMYWYAAARVGVFAPSNPLVFQNDAYMVCRPDRETAWWARQVRTKQSDASDIVPKDFRGPGNWYLCAALPEEYTGFSPLAYSLDVFLPFVDLQQVNAWAPMVPTPKVGYVHEFTHIGWKHFVRLVFWFETLFGWFVSLLTVAIVSGLTKKRDVT